MQIQTFAQKTSLANLKASEGKISRIFNIGQSKKLSWKVGIVGLLERVKTVIFSENRFRLSANRTSPGVGKFFKRNVTAILIAADGADVFADRLILIGDIRRGIFGSFPFDDFMVIRISHGGIAARNFRADHFAQEYCVGWRIHCIDDAAGDVSTAVGNYRECVAHLVSYVIEFVEIFSRAESESTDDGGIGIFCKDGNRKIPAIGDATVGIVVFVDADHDGSGICRDLGGAICAAAGRSAVVPG